MIASAISGGLGNQMFMYAMARAMALRNEASLAFNIHLGFDSDFLYHRKLEINNLNVQLPQNPIQTFDYKGSKYVRAFSRTIGRNLIYPCSKFIKEKKPSHFQKELLLEKSKNLYLEGYWQSENYFKDYEDIIRNDFQIKKRLSDNIHKEYNTWRSDDSTLIFVGVRRYQECKSTKTGMVLQEDYYNKAIEIIESKISNPKFIIFTQDQKWAESHLKSKSPMVFSLPKEGELSSIEDMFLMTHCDHAIISNSSYYWWGAWLQHSHPNNHIVVASNNFVNKDFVCKSWIQI